MIYDYLIKLMGAGIAAIIAFLPLNVDYNSDALIIETELTSPVTDEILELVKQDFDFCLEYYCSIIINDKKTYRSSFIRKLSWQEKYYIDGIEVNKETLQKQMGKIKFEFSDLNFSEGDEILIFIKAIIQPDDIFKQSTGMSTRILWNHYVPRIKTNYILKNGKFREK